MRYTRVSVGGRAVWGRVGERDVELLSGSPLDATRREPHGERGPTVIGAVPRGEAVWLPVVVPPVFYAVGMNYPRHIQHAGAEAPTRPEVGYRANNALTGHGSPIVKPAGVTGRFEAEPELVAVIGRTLRHATYEEAREGVFGWTIGNDVSARAWQHQDRTFWRSKNSDTFKPMGPWIETDVDALAQTTTLRVNGEVRAAFRTGDMVFDPFDHIVEITRHITMRPGDVLWMGAESTCQIEPGDTVDVEISGIGVLSNPVHPEGNSA
ncbi:MULTISPECIES: fumarylacetoacetate hydrolase family protein [unclassified Streptomyces]|uniref:fumarylacetoacetate hydrolase family protein n=1 Tax=unclassified Streptomyces TaxID=2593676 RepID=UPI002253B956|nr:MULTISPECIES: fumarylacetoacetate hydrolase family protein [unclassified Streptomyces]MCX4993024.1 fumarylacetoacetate hydrolase family protein [Streptomyces sp. NBC_00568]MCX5001740.1 fumarylacetoacetate hydrolase family protein [Streptomyces sp. NBC_00638]